MNDYIITVAIIAYQTYTLCSYFVLLLQFTLKIPLKSNIKSKDPYLVLNSKDPISKLLLEPIKEFCLTSYMVKENFFKCIYKYIYIIWTVNSKKQNKTKNATACNPLHYQIFSKFPSCFYTIISKVCRLPLPQLIKPNLPSIEH